MNIKLRTAVPDDAQRCGTICYEAFTAIANQYNFPPDLPSADVTIGLLSKLIADPRFYAIVAEFDHQVVGSNFMDERSAIAGIGPITIDPTAQNRGIGRALMGDCMARAAERRVPGVRLLQAGYHTRSLSLYTKLGFVTREPLAVMHYRSPVSALRRLVRADKNFRVAHIRTFARELKRFHSFA